MTEATAEPRAYQVLIDLQTALDAWRRVHPQAAFAEIEEGVAAILNRARVVMLEQLAARTAGIPTRCPTCGRSMVSRGERIRALQAEGGEVVRLRRPYYTCPECQGAMSWSISVLLQQPRGASGVPRPRTGWTSRRQRC